LPEKKYFLNSSELNELLGEESYILVQKYELFEWRNWRLIPKNQKYWIIENINT
jgi:ribonuclease HI